MRTCIKQAMKTPGYVSALEIPECKTTAVLFDTRERDSHGKHILSYQVWHQGRLLFSGNDYHLSPFHKPYHVGAFTDLLGFMSLKPGDTDDEYFSRYTQEQMMFALSQDCELLSVYQEQLEEGIEEGIHFYARKR